MKVKFLIAALFFSLVAAAQPSNYIKFNTRGRWIAGMFDSTLHVPRFNGSPSLRTGGSSMDGAIAIDTTNSIMYFYSGGTWKRANLDTSAYAVTSVYRKTASDSVFYVKGGVHTFAFKDSTGGGTPTLQQVLTAGSTLTGVNDIHLDGNEFRFLGGSGDFLVQDVNLIDLINDNDNGIQIGTAEGVLIRPNVGVLKIDSLNYTLSTTGKKVLIRDTATGLVQNIDPSLLGASSYTFTNGLTDSSGTVKLGGTLTEATTTLDGGTTSTLRFQDMIFDVTGSIVIMMGDSIHLTGGTSTNRSDIILKDDTIKVNPGLGIAMIDTLSAASNMTNKKVMTWDTVTKRWEQIAKDSVGGGGSTSPAGNYGNLQINRNGAFATPGSDSLTWASATGLTSLGNIGVGVTTSTHRLSILDNQTTRDVLKIRNLSSSGYSSIGFFGYTDAQTGGFGYANGGIAGPVSDAIYFYSNSKDLVFSKDATATSSMTIRGSTGTVGIVNAFIGNATGTTTARLHISAPTSIANTGQLKLASGTPPTTPETGLINFQNGLLLLDSSTSVRDTIATREWVEANIAVIEGTYTPTLYNTTNVAASSAFPCFYIRQGDYVHVWGEVEIDATTALTVTELGMELPIASSITNSPELAGTAAHEDNTAVQVKGDPTNDRAKFRLTPQTNTANVYSFHFSYKYVAP